jgi:hypothetical protein
VHRTPRVTPPPSSNTCCRREKQQNKTVPECKLPTGAALGQRSGLPQQYRTAAQPANLNVMAQTAIVLHTAPTRKPGGQQSSTFEIKIADAYLVTWPNTRMDIVHPNSRQSPTAPNTTPPHLPTETRSTECAYRGRGHISTGIRHHSVCVSHSPNPSFIWQLHLSLPVATLPHVWAVARVG